MVLGQYKLIIISLILDQGFKTVFIQSGTDTTMEEEIQKRQTINYEEL